MGTHSGKIGYYVWFPPTAGKKRAEHRSRSRQRKEWYVNIYMLRMKDRGERER